MAEFEAIGKPVLKPSTPLKLTAPKWRVMKFLEDGPAVVSQLTDERKGTIHGPTAERLAALGLIEISEKDQEPRKGERTASLSRKGWTAIGCPE